MESDIECRLGYISYLEFPYQIQADSFFWFLFQQDPTTLRNTKTKSRSVMILTPGLIYYYFNLVLTWHDAWYVQHPNDK